MGTILFLSYSEVFPQFLLWVKGKRFVYVFPSCSTRSDVHMLRETITLTICENLSLGVNIQWVYRTQKRMTAGGEEKARDFLKWRACMRWASRGLNKKIGWFEQIVYIFPSLRSLRSLIIHCMGEIIFAFLLTS